MILRKILITLGLLCFVIFLSESIYKLFYFNSANESRNIRAPLEQSVIDNIYSGLFNMSNRIKVPQSLPEYRNPCWYFKLYENVTTMYNRPEFKKHYSFRLNDLLQFRNKELITLYKNNNPQLRCLPHVYFIGFPKCASTDFYFRLTQHQQIFQPTVKEFHWWTKKRGRNIDLDIYMHEFDIAAHNIRNSCPVTSNKTNVVPCVTVDGSPSTAFWNTQYWNTEQMLTPDAEALTPAFLKRLLPNVQILVIMKKPTLRLHSEFFCFHSSKERNPAHFHRAAVQSQHLMQGCISVNGPRQCAYNNTLHRLFKVRIHVGMYSVFVKDWLKIFNRKQIFALTTEEYANQTDSVLNGVARFLDLEPYSSTVLDKLQLEQHRNDHSKGHPNSSVTMWAKTKKLLDDFYRPYNDELAELLGDTKFKWDAAF